jgi:hypothetical protein
MTEQQYAQEFLCDFTASTGNTTLFPVSIAVSSGAKGNERCLCAWWLLRCLVLMLHVMAMIEVLYSQFRGLKAYEPIMFNDISNIDFANAIICKDKKF